MRHDTDLDALLLSIAKRHTCFETLETRNSDSLDFHEVSAEGLRRALVAAYEAGRAVAVAARCDHTPSRTNLPS